MAMETLKKVSTANSKPLISVARSLPSGHPEVRRFQDLARIPAGPVSTLILSSHLGFARWLPQCSHMGLIALVQLNSNAG